MTGRRQPSRGLHAHGCRCCHVRYEDACGSPTVDGLCTTCRGGRAWKLLIENRAPHDCCRTGSRRANKDETARYRLAGEHTWWICAGTDGCRRTHPYDPANPPDATERRRS